MDIKTAIKNDPMVSRNRGFMILFGALATFYVLIDVSALITWQSGHSLSITFLLGPMWVLNFLLYFWQYRFWKRIASKRYAVMMSNQIIQVQPVTDGLVQALPQALRIRQQPRKLIITSIISSTILFLVVFLALILFFGWDMRWVPLAAIILLIAIIIFVIAILVGFNSKFITYVELFPEGIRTYFGGRAYSIRWQHIRVFARYENILPLNLRRGKRKPHFVYELSGISGTGETIVAYWQLPAYQGMIIEPPMTLEQYERYPEQLAALITARTGLSLLDFDTWEGVEMFHVKR